MKNSPKESSKKRDKKKEKVRFWKFNWFMNSIKTIWAFQNIQFWTEIKTFYLHLLKISGRALRARDERSDEMRREWIWKKKNEKREKRKREKHPKKTKKEIGVRSFSRLFLNIVLWIIQIAKSQTVWFTLCSTPERNVFATNSTTRVWNRATGNRNSNGPNESEATHKV